MAGNCPGSNSTSTTLPMIWTIFPVAPPVCSALIGVYSSSLFNIILFLFLQRLGPADNVHQFSRNGGLPRLVIRQAQAPGQNLTVSRSVVHGCHPGGMLHG